MEFIIITVLVVVVIAYIAYPLFNAPEEPQADMNSALDSLIAQRDSAYDAIRDLDFDYQLGKLSRSDYESLRDKYRARAAEALRQIDQAGAAGKTDEAIEEQIARLRRRRPIAANVQAEGALNGETVVEPKPVDEIELQVARLRKRAQPATLRCPNCNALYHQDDVYCPKCGEKLPSRPSSGSL